MAKYTVEKGDTLSKIAKEYRTTVSAIQKANSTLIKDVDKIRVGWVLEIPATDNTAIGQLVKTCLSEIQKLDSFKKLEDALE